jgi:hypothetical protein
MAISGYPRHLSKSGNNFLLALTMQSTGYPQGFHRPLPGVTTVLSGEPCLARAVRYVFSS